jgi:hypothetical protein
METIVMGAGAIGGAGATLSARKARPGAQRQAGAIFSARREERTASFHAIAIMPPNGLSIR